MISAQSKKAGEKAVKLLLVQWNTQEGYVRDISSMEAQILEGHDDIVMLGFDLDEKRILLQKLTQDINRGMNALSAADKDTLKRYRTSVYFRLRINALALKTRIRSNLVKRRFALDRLERDYVEASNGMTYHNLLPIDLTLLCFISTQWYG